MNEYFNKMALILLLSGIALSYNLKFDSIGGNNYMLSVFDTADSDTLRESIKREWKSDSLGCLQLRSRKKAEVLLDNLKPSDISTSFLLENFGVPNEIKRNEGREVFVYYYGTMCLNGKILELSDKCYLSFYITEDSLSKKIYLCE